MKELALFVLVFGVTSALLTIWFVSAHRREAWVRYTNAEAAFWRRLRVPESIIESSKQIEQSPGFSILVGVTGAILLLAFFVLVGVYVWLVPREPKEQPPRSNAYASTVRVAR